MSSAHVAGLVAYLIAKDGNVSPAEMSEKIKGLAVKRAIIGVRTSSNADMLVNNPSSNLHSTALTTENLLAQIGPVA